MLKPKGELKLSKKKRCMTEERMKRPLLLKRHLLWKNQLLKLKNQQPQWKVVRTLKIWMLSSNKKEASKSLPNPALCNHFRSRCFEYCKKNRAGHVHTFVNPG